jgi:GDP-L-fucose synthase
MRVWITGGQGLLGSEIDREVRLLFPLSTVLSPSRTELDLSEFKSVNNFVQTFQPTHVFHTAATVMGISGHSTQPTKAEYDNLRIDLNVFEALNRHPPKWIFYASTVAAYGYPFRRVPLIEEDFLIGDPHKSERGYALAKRRALDLLSSLEINHNSAYSYGILTNLYGEKDRDKFGQGHVIAGLISRAVKAKKQNSSLLVWGSGQASRDFISASKASQLAVSLIDKNTHEVNIASGIETTIKSIALKISEYFDLKTGVQFTLENEGIIRRFSDVQKLKSFVGDFETESIDLFLRKMAFSIEEPLKKSYDT